MNYPLDAYALLAFINKEAGWERVRDLLEKAEAGEINVLMNAINVHEVYYKKLHKDGQHVASDIYHSALDSAISIIVERHESISFFWLR
jgi:PIN domain nuclease of toxin-antitoxin system